MPCLIAPAPTEAWHRWTIPQGTKVTLFAQGTNGKVLIAGARYDGESLPVYQRTVDGERVTVVDVTGADTRKNLQIVYGFSSGPAGRGVLRVCCDGHASRVIDDYVVGDEPARVYRIGPPLD